MIDFLYEEAVARPGAFSQYDMMAVYPALQKIPKNGLYVEIGVMNGRSLMFARKHSKGTVVGIDIHRYNNWDEVFEGYKNWEFIHGNANDVVKTWDRKIDVLFIDGDHSHEAVQKDWKKWSPFVKKGGMVFFHDADDTSPGVLKVWQEIKGKEKGLSRDDLEGRNTSIAWVKI